MLGLIVTDATAEEARLREAGVRVVVPLRDEPWGQRHFFLTDPPGVLIDMIQMIPPSPQRMANHRLV